jgi:hypothetical protein
VRSPWRQEGQQLSAFHLSFAITTMVLAMLWLWQPAAAVLFAGCAVGVVATMSVVEASPLPSPTQNTVQVDNVQQHQQQQQADVQNIITMSLVSLLLLLLWPAVGVLVVGLCLCLPVLAQIDFADLLTLHWQQAERQHWGVKLVLAAMLPLLCLCCRAVAVPVAAGLVASRCLPFVAHNAALGMYAREQAAGAGQLQQQQQQIEAHCIMTMGVATLLALLCWPAAGVIIATLVFMFMLFKAAPVQQQLVAVACLVPLLMLCWPLVTVLLVVVAPYAALLSKHLPAPVILESVNRVFSGAAPAAAAASSRQHGPPNAQRASSKAASVANSSVECGICLVQYPASDMAEAAMQSALQSIQRRCRHLAAYCLTCARRYLQTQLQV